MQANLWNTPRSKQGWDIWGFSHRASHDLIRQAILAKGGPNLTDYPIYPIDLDRIAEFLQANAQLHIDFNNTLGTQGVDLQDVDPKNEAQLRAWIQLHVQEHINAEQRLGIGS